MLGLVRKGMFPIPGNGTNYWNPVHSDNAAEAMVMAVQNHEAGLGRIFNLCDDEPVALAEMLRFLAEKLAARKPIRIPRFVARMMMGRHVFDSINPSFRCRNEAIKEQLKWTPRYPSFRDGYMAVIDAWEPGS